MDNPAQVSDIESRWRPLSGQDAITAQSWLNDAWNILQIDSPGIVGRIEAASVPVDLVKATLADAVIRKAQNPEGRYQNSVAIDDATRSWTLDKSRSSGELYFTEAELRRLGGPAAVRGKAFSIMPS